jgi:hypothetical protein
MSLRQRKIHLEQPMQHIVHFLECVLLRLETSQRNALDHETNQHFMQQLSTKKANKDQVQIKGIFNNKTTGNCAY